MFANIKSIAIFAIIFVSLQCAMKMPFDFKGRPADNVLLSHLHHLTRYEHTFNGQDKGSCGVLFDLAVEQYKANMQNKNIMLIADDLLEEGNSFSQSDCEHVSEGYTWVLLKISDDEKNCDIHIPLNLKNYEHDDEDHPLLNMHYALEAISDRDSHCYDNEGNTLIKMPKIEAAYIETPVITYTEVTYHGPDGRQITKEEFENLHVEQKKPVHDLSEEDLTDEQFKYFDKDGNGLTKEQFDRMNEELAMRGELSDVSSNLSAQKSIDLPSINAVYQADNKTINREIEFESLALNKSNHSVEDRLNLSTRKSFHNSGDEIELRDEHMFLAEPNGMLGSPKACTHEDRLRVTELYAAMITKNHTAGIVLYTENITECLVRSEAQTQFEAVLSVNNTECYFSVYVHKNEGELEFTEQNDTELDRCEDLSY